MIWAVIDTNTWVSGFGWASTVPSEVVDRFVQGGFMAVLSRPLLEELADVLVQPKLARVFEDPMGILVLVQAVGVQVAPVAEVHVVADEPDNRLLEAAMEAHADYLVTGDQGLLNVGAFEGVRIVNAKQFLAILAGDTNQGEQREQ
ncbi:MAG: putative toxin-antitoxin system toxin component, PIN family [Actinobacteria bacterium]|nr:putative toxin-antitoxin system toxin component, PIN family [Actinomycetota bacterium]